MENVNFDDNANLKGATTLFYGNIYSKILYSKEGAPKASSTFHLPL